MSAQNASEPRLENAGQIISSACGWSAATAFIPLPYFDLAALAAVQGNMANDLAKLYGHSFTDEAVKATVSILLGTLVPGVMTSSLKLAPGIGTLVGAAAHAAFSGAATYAIGKVLVRHFEAGGSPMSFDAKAIGDDLKKEFLNAQKKPA